MHVFRLNIKRIELVIQMTHCISVNKIDDKFMFH